MDAGDRIDVLSRAPQTIAGHFGYGVALAADTGAYLDDGPTGDEPGVAAWDGTRLLASGLTATGAGPDRALVDRGDRVSRDCESVRRR